MFVVPPGCIYLIVSLAKNQMVLFYLLIHKTLELSESVLSFYYDCMYTFTENDLLTIADH